METGFKISDEAVKKATGKDWAEWVKMLDKAGMADKTHKEIARWIWDNYGSDARADGISGWWCQGVTVGYEYAKGLRTVGDTTQGIEIGVSKTFPVSSEILWQILMSQEGMAVWLGTQVELEPGAPYKTADGTSGQIRTVKEGRRLRLTYQPKDWGKPSTLQLWLEPKDGKTSLTFHNEKLPSKAHRAKMRKHWRHVLDQLMELC